MRAVTDSASLASALTYLVGTPCDDAMIIFTDSSTVYEMPSTTILNIPLILDARNLVDRPVLRVSNPAHRHFQLVASGTLTALYLTFEVRHTHISRYINIKIYILLCIAKKRPWHMHVMKAYTEDGPPCACQAYVAWVASPPHTSCAE